MSQRTTLEIVDCPLPEKHDPGPLPQLTWLSVASLRIDQNYQRPVMGKGFKNIARIVQQFRWNRFSPLIVTAGPDGLFDVIDGQHRAIAAQRLGIKELPCQVVAITHEGDAPRIFAAINGEVTPMAAQALYKASLASKEEWAITIARIAKRARLDVLFYPVQISKQKPRQTMMVGTLRNRILRYGEEIVGLALEGLMAAPGADKPGFARTLALDAAIARVHATPDAFVDRAATVRALSLMEFDHLIRSVIQMPGKASYDNGKPTGSVRPLQLIKSDTREKILDFSKRKFTPSQIAAVLKLPHAEVRRVLEDAQP